MDHTPDHHSKRTPFHAQCVRRFPGRDAVVDHTKINKDAFLRVCDLRQLDAIVTDKEADDAFVAGARKLGIEVVQV